MSQFDRVYDTSLSMNLLFEVISQRYIGLVVRVPHFGRLGLRKNHGTSMNTLLNLCDLDEDMDASLVSS